MKSPQSRRDWIVPSDADRPSVSRRDFFGSLHSADFFQILTAFLRVSLAGRIAVDQSWKEDCENGSRKSPLIVDFNRRFQGTNLSRDAASDLLTKR